MITYSLICNGGRAGKTVTMTIANPCVVTLTNNNQDTGSAIVFSTTGALPTGITAGVTYYLRIVNANTFNLYDTAEHAIAGGTTGRVTTSGSQSGVHTMSKPSLFWDTLSTAQKARYGTAGSERVYWGLKDWYAARAAATISTSDTEVCEIGEAFIDIENTGTINLTLPAASTRIESKINGVRSAAFHGGVIGAGYTFKYVKALGGVGIVALAPSTIVDGITSWGAITSAGCFSINKMYCVIRNCIARGVQTGGDGSQTGIAFSAPGSQAYNNIAYNLATGINVAGFQNARGSVLYNNTVTLCTTGIASSSSPSSDVVAANNIAIGNTTDWPTTYTPTFSLAGKNAGVVGDTPWNAGAATAFEMATTDFLDYAGLDFRPALSTSPQVNNGMALYEGHPSDIAELFRPDYEAATYPDNLWDVGAHEFNHGEGNTPPNLRTFTVDGFPTGARVKIKKTSDGTSIYNGVVGATSLAISYDAGVANTPVTIDIAKGAAAPYYYRYRTTASISYTGDSGVTVALIPDIAADTYAAGIASDFAVDTTTKVISHVSGTTRYTAQDLYSWLCAYYDHADRVDLDMPLYGTTSEIFGLQNSGSISDADMEFLKGGSIMDGTTLWSNIYTVGGKEAGTPIYVHIDEVLYTSFWADGDIDVLLKFPLWSGAEVVDVRAHKFSDTYDHWSMTVGEGRNVAAIGTANDPNNQTLEATVADYSDITITMDNPVTYAIDAYDTAGDYKGTIDASSRGVLEVYERGKYLAKNPSTYESADPAFAEIKTSPYGTFAGGVLSVAKGYRLINVSSLDALNYVLTDNAGVTHQAAAPPVQILVTNLVAGETYQIYDLTNSIELANGVTTGTTFALEKTWAGDLDIRVRHIFVSGVSATQFQEEQGTFTSSGMTLRANQDADAVHNANAIDGSLVTGVTINDGLLLVQVATGSISWQQLYAYETYWLSTEEGIRDEGRYATAVDVANYLWYDFKLKNTTSPSVPLVVTGGYGKDGDTGNSLAMLDTTGGTIILAPDHVVPYSSGAEATVAIVQAGLTAQGFTTARAPKIDNLDAAVSSIGGGSAPTAAQIRAEIDTNSTKLKTIVGLSAAAASK